MGFQKHYTYMEISNIYGSTVKNIHCPPEVFNFWILSDWYKWSWIYNVVKCIQILRIKYHRLFLIWGWGGMPLVKSSKMFKSLKFNPAFLKLGDIRIQIPLSLLYSSPMCQPIENTFNYFEIQCYHGNS